MARGWSLYVSCGIRDVLFANCTYLELDMTAVPLFFVRRLEADVAGADGGSETPIFVRFERARDGAATDSEGASPLLSPYEALRFLDEGCGRAGGWGC
jgi:hypothetical protein